MEMEVDMKMKTKWTRKFSARAMTRTGPEMEKFQLEPDNPAE